MLQALERVKKNVFILGKGMPKALTSGLPASLRLMFMLEITFVSIFSSFLNSVRLVARFYQNIWGKIKIQTTKTRIYFKTLYQIYQCTWRTNFMFPLSRSAVLAVVVSFSTCQRIKCDPVKSTLLRQITICLFYILLYRLTLTKPRSANGPAAVWDTRRYSLACTQAWPQWLGKGPLLLSSHLSPPDALSFPRLDHDCLTKSNLHANISRV